MTPGEAGRPGEQSPLARPPGDTGASTESGGSGERRSLPADEGDAVSDTPPLPTPVGQ